MFLKLKCLICLNDSRYEIAGAELFYKVCCPLIRTLALVAAAATYIISLILVRHVLYSCIWAGIWNSFHVLALTIEYNQRIIKLNNIHTLDILDNILDEDCIHFPPSTLFNLTRNLFSWKRILFCTLKKRQKNYL